MLTTMKQYPNPKQWAAFTLIGEADWRFTNILIQGSHFYRCLPLKLEAP
jgi:hypothetical protein